MKWRPLLYPSSSRQPLQAIASVQNSNLKCVSRLRATLYLYSIYVIILLRISAAIIMLQSTVCG